MLVNFIGFKKHGDEYQQAVTRLIVVASIFVYLFQSHSSFSIPVKLAIIFFTSVVIIITIHTRLYTAPKTSRQILSMLVDVAGVSVMTYLSGDSGSAFVGIFLWLVIGYGFRFGKKLLLSTFAASLLGFTIASYFNEFFANHPALKYGFYFTLISIPLYALALLTKLQEATRKAEAASEAKSEFLSHISHEIRTPLNGIIGASGLIDQSKLDQNNKPLFGVIENSSNMLLDLVNNVLDLSAIENGKTKSVHEEFYLENLIITTSNIFEAQAINKNIGVHYSITEDTPNKVSGDFMHTKQVLINLVGNAVKFTEKGGVSIHVSTVSQDNDHARVRFEITDTGIGISSEAIDKIFESFTQAGDKIKFKFGGTGLGTTISKNLVELMGGQIGIESELDVGTTFWFEIPLDIVDAQGEPESDIISLKEFAENEAQRSYHILVAEDNDTNILILSQMLNLGNHTFDVVKNGQLALDMLEENTYDLMILDHNMPKMGGLEALQIYQSINVGQVLIPAIILSADATEGTKAQFEDTVDVAAYLTKPIQMNLLLETIQKTANGQQDNIAEASENVINQAKADVISFDDAVNGNDSPEKNTNDDAATNDVLSYINTARLDDLIAISHSPAFLHTLVSGFIEDTDAHLKTMAEYIAANDFEGINNVAHAMAGSAVNVGAEKFGAICEQLEAMTPSDQASLLPTYNRAIDAYNASKDAYALFNKQQADALSTSQY